MDGVKDLIWEVFEKLSLNYHGNTGVEQVNTLS